MEDILLDAVVFGFDVAALHVAIVTMAATGALFGYMAEEERTGARLFWAEWPVYEKVEAPTVERELRAAA